MRSLVRLALALFIAAALLPTTARAEYYLLVYHYTPPGGFPIPVGRDGVLIIESPVPPVITPVCGMEIRNVDTLFYGEGYYYTWLDYRVTARDVGVIIAARDQAKDITVQGDCAQRNASSPAETLYLTLVAKAEE